MESFTKIEKIEYSCERCKTHGPFEKELLVDRAPFVAALHFKIFKNNGVVVHKVDKHVSFPLELDMLLYTSKINNVSIFTWNFKYILFLLAIRLCEEMRYDLYTFIVHSGSSISSGNDYTFIRCAQMNVTNLMTIDYGR